MKNLPVVYQDNKSRREHQLTFDFEPDPGRDRNKYFYFSREWIRFRYLTLVARGNNCEACGNSWEVGNPIQVDHVKPISTHPHLRLEQDNVQVLCRACNQGKSNIDTTDWRRKKSA